ncbi:MAG: sodium-independent anion transporter [Thermoleophilia bacterium]|nr:sodium-independent anion transporter [Thermoleophilia bacterium]
MIVRWSAELFFANASHFRDQIQTLIAEAEVGEGTVQAVLLDASAIINIDVTGADTLAGLAAAGLDRAIPENHRFESVRDGAAYFERRLAGREPGS